MKLTDEQIIKALECCNSTAIGQCLKKCPYYNYAATCINTMVNDALDLINRQKAEIEKLEEDNNFHIRLEALLAEQRGGRDELIEQIDAQNNELRIRLKTTKAEAIKEFVERLKKEIAHIPAWGSVAEKKIDNLVKEMVGE